MKSQRMRNYGIINVDAVLLISDIHANLAALETVLADAEGRYDTIWCLGDVVGYGPKPNECIELVRDRAALCVMGNHDWAVLDKPGINVEDQPAGAPRCAVDAGGVARSCGAIPNNCPTPRCTRPLRPTSSSITPARASRCGNIS